MESVSCQFGSKTLTIETGKLAKQADGSVMVSYGDTRVLVTVCSANEIKPGASFFPLTVEYSEKFYSSGKIPGSFFRREGRPSSDATLAARMIDRPIRPLFPEGYLFDTQVIATIMSLDPEADPEVAASIGASAALTISDIPFSGPTAACRIGRKDGEWVINPSWAQMNQKEIDLEILVAGTADAITMVEGGASEASEDDVLAAILKGHDEIKKVVQIIRELGSKAGKPKREFKVEPVPQEINQEVEKAAKEGLLQALQTKEKLERYQLMDKTKDNTKEQLVPESFAESDPKAAEEKLHQVKEAFENLKYRLAREMILESKKRIDGRGTTDIRPIAVEVGLLPRAHGSSLFTRGETQILGAITLGSADDEQIIDSLYEDNMRKFLFHYNFPPFSVGETGRYGGQSRREIGHGALAERAVAQMMPTHDEFPYTVRVVCETLESNGSSSMGSVCASSMALMHAGVPLKKPVAGIAMGLIKEDDRVAILSDILGDEDHLGDMDFKVAGTQDGVTSIQMDIKIQGVTEEIMRTALAQAKEGRMHILSKMSEAIEQPNADLAAHAPRITTVQIPVAKIGAVVGPGGKMIKEIIAETGCKIDIEDTGKVNIISNDGEAADKARKKIEGIVAEAEVGKTYKGTVKRIVEFGAFVEILPNQEGLLHISEIAYERVETVEDFFKEGDEIEVKVLDVDRTGRIKLSRKELLPVPEGYTPPPAGGGRGGGDRRPPRDRDRFSGGGRGGRGGRGGGDRRPRGRG